MFLLVAVDRPLTKPLNDALSTSVVCCQMSMSNCITYKPTCSISNLSLLFLCNIQHGLGKDKTKKKKSCFMTPQGAADKLPRVMSFEVMFIWTEIYKFKK